VQGCSVTSQRRLFHFFEQGKVEEVISLSISLLEVFWNVKFWSGSLD
jgi:hypothetical protein